MTSVILGVIGILIQLRFTGRGKPQVKKTKAP